MLVNIVNSLGVRKQIEVTRYESNGRGIHVYLGETDISDLIPFLKANDFLIRFDDASYHVRLYLFINDRTNGKEPFLDLSVHEKAKTHEDLLGSFFDNCKELEKKAKEREIINNYYA